MFAVIFLISTLGWTIANIEQEQAAGILRADIPVAYQARLVLGLLDQMARLLDGPNSIDRLASLCAILLCDALAAKR